MTERLVVQIDSDLKRRLEQIAAKEDRTVSSLIRIAARRLVANEATTPDPDRAKRITDATNEIAKNYTGKIRQSNS